MAIERSSPTMLKKSRLFTPGPTPLQPAVQEALARPILHHRTDEFRAVFKECTAGLKQFLKTDDEVLILSCSGTGGMEAALVSVLSPGDAMLALVAGNFGERWAAIGRAHGMAVTVLEAEWGDAVPAERVAEALDRDPRIRGVFVQLSESSTGAAHDVEAIARVTRGRKDTVLVVDAISGAGAMRLETAAWGVDVVVVGSQKALALPPGLAFVSMSSRAWAAAERAETPRFYFDLARERKAQAAGESAFTPAISSVVALRAALAFVASMGGVDELVRNAGVLGASTRAAAQALGLPLVAPRAHGDALTALYAPSGVESGAIVKALKAEFASTVAGGQGKLKGQILRIAHLGYYDATDILGLLATLEIVLRRLGHRFDLGAGLAAAEAEYLRLTP
ncbi:MAG: alanine--glyoxylate aminotransferase family protein [Acidobacteria bacterium]|nr:MAG: alanine--glyoxylate aminotransferase family protein [Acidobacteriota bacterium]